MVNILAVSDESLIENGGNYLAAEVKEKIDILVNCGDLGPIDLQKLEMDFKPSVKLMVYGNHDKGAFASNKLTNGGVTGYGRDERFLPNNMKYKDEEFESKEFSELYKTTVLNKALHKVKPGKNNGLDDEIIFGGFSGSMTEGMNKERKWPFYFTEKKARSFAKSLKRKRKWKRLFGSDLSIDIMMSHAAPDIGGFYGDLGSHHLPSKALGEIQKEFMPSLWLYGHIHPSYTTENLDFKKKDSYILNAVPFKFIDYDEKKKKVVDYYPK
ncbi:MAG: metallophosphoesterase family protein [Nanobdellota archaeon]